MLSDEEFYKQLLPHLRAKSAGQAQVITPKDASATRSNGEKASDGVTESDGPGDPKLSIIVRHRGSRVPEHQRGTNFRDSGNRVRSTQAWGWAEPLVDQDNPGSQVDGLVRLDDGTTDKVKITKVQTANKYSGPHFQDVVSFALTSLTKEETAYIIQFEGRTTKTGHFRTDKAELNDIANDWMVRYMIRKDHGR